MSWPATRPITWSKWEYSSRFVRSTNYWFFCLFHSHTFWSSQNAWSIKKLSEKFDLKNSRNDLYALNPSSSNDFKILWQAKYSPLVPFGTVYLRHVFQKHVFKDDSNTLIHRHYFKKTISQFGKSVRKSVCKTGKIENYLVQNYKNAFKNVFN